MTSPELDNLVKIGKLKREPAGEPEIGYRSDSRFLVFQTLVHTLGLEPATWRVLAKGHETRNLAEYEGSSDIDERLVEDVIRAAMVVRRALRTAGG